MHLLALILLAVEILPARVDPSAGVVRFAPESDAPDWEALGKQKVATASAAELQRLWQARDLFDGTAVTFTAELPAALRSKMYYFISTRGVVPLTPVSLEGQARYEFESNAPAPKLRRIDYTGEVVATLPTKDRTAGGFSFVSDQPLRFTVKPVDLGSLSATRAALTYLDEGIRRNGRIDPGAHPEEIVFASRLTVEPTHEDFLFVQWKPDDSFCEFSFSLLKIMGDAMEEVTQSAYNCDV